MPAAPTAAPRGVTLQAASSTVLDLRWVSPSNEEWNGERRGFRVVLVEVESNRRETSFTIDNSRATSHRIPSLHPAYNYQCRIAAFNSAGTGPYSDTVTATLLEDGRGKKHEY